MTALSSADEFIKLFEAATPAKQRIVFIMVTLMKVYPKSKRAPNGRFRKLPTDERYMIELLATLKTAHDYQDEDEQAVIQAWIDMLERAERDKQADN